MGCENSKPIGVIQPIYKEYPSSGTVPPNQIPPTRTIPNQSSSTGNQLPSIGNQLPSIGNQLPSTGQLPFPAQTQKKIQDMKQPSVQERYSNFENNILRLHNLAREQNGLPPLVWDKALQQRAQDWGQFLMTKYDRKCSSMRHPGTGPDGNQEEIGKYLPNNNGQNIYQSNGVKMENGAFVPYDPSSPRDAVMKWYDECNLYTPPKENQPIPERFMEVGHMTQLLWKDAKQVGCAFVECGDTVRDESGNKLNSGGRMIVCNYDKGNVAGQFLNQLPQNIKCEKENNWIN